MMSSDGLLYNIKLSTVGPGIVTDPDMVFEPSGMDLAMKLHYIKNIYYFESGAFESMNNLEIEHPMYTWFNQFPTLAYKEPMFKWFNQFPEMCGRFRRGNSGRPYIRCNDAGTRFIEAKCDRTINEWLEIKDANLEKLLVPNQALGPVLGFSPLVLLQYTKFKCGGMAVGLSWAHVLGDAFYAAEFMKKLGDALVEVEPGRPVRMTHEENMQYSFPIGMSEKVEYPLAIKRVGPVGDNWVNPTFCKMEPFSFDVNPTKLSELQSRSNRHGNFLPPFEIVSALIWQCITKIRVEMLEPNVITVIRKAEQNDNSEVMSNSQVVSVVKSDVPILGARLSDLAILMKKDVLDESKGIEEAVDKEHGLRDTILYGANLTFVNLEEAKFYEFEYKGYKPLNVSFRIDGVGEQGAVFVLPQRKGGGGRSVVIVLRQNEAFDLKAELTEKGF